MDTQTVKTSANAPAHIQGIDADMKIIGRKRGIVTDTLGLLLALIDNVSRRLTGETTSTWRDT